MLIAPITVAVLGCIGGIGIMLILLRNVRFTRIGISERFKKQKINRNLAKTLNRSQEENLFPGTSIYLNRGLYSAVRIAITVILFIISIISTSVVTLVIVAILFLVSYPEEYTKTGKKLPWHFIVEMVKRHEKSKMDDELLESLSILKNLIVQLRNNPVSAEYIIENLASNSNRTKRAYTRFLSLFTLNRKAEAEAAFISEIDTEISRDIAGLLVQLDILNPSELEEAIQNRQHYVRETKLTKSKKRDELVSDLIYLPVLVTVIVIFFNFLYIGFLMNLDFMVIL